MVNLTLCPDTMLLVLKLSKLVLLYPDSNLPVRNLLTRADLPTLVSPTMTTVVSCLVFTLMLMSVLTPCVSLSTPVT